MVTKRLWKCKFADFVSNSSIRPVIYYAKLSLSMVRKADVEYECLAAVVHKPGPFSQTNEAWFTKLWFKSSLSSLSYDAKA
jgi:hypothetical protein